MPAYALHLVFEEFTQRLDELQLHVRREAAYVVMALDDVGLAGLDARRLDDVGVNRALSQELDALGWRGASEVRSALARELLAGSRRPVCP